ncbi:kelch domain-containing protein 2-like [Branchiostoma floridae x Branchiostoma japonicum]
MEGAMAAEQAPCLPRERSGHVAVIWGTRMFVWGGYVDEDPQEGADWDRYLPTEELWIYDTETQTWTKEMTSGQYPPAMSGSCSALLGGFMYIFGGHYDMANSNKLFRLNLRTLEWQGVEGKGIPPSQRDKLGCWVYERKLIYFGGYGFRPQSPLRGQFEPDEAVGLGLRGWNNHLCVFDTVAEEWYQPETTGEVPVPRAAHACARIDNRGYLFGGRYLETRMNDLHCINLDTWEWSGRITVPGGLPLGRSWHSLTPISTNQLFLYGGFTTQCQPLSDGWVLDTNTHEWMNLDYLATDKPRLWHTGCSTLEGEVFVFGGCSTNLLQPMPTVHCNDILVFSVMPRSLQRICLDTIVHHKDVLAPLCSMLPRELRLRLERRLGIPLTNPAPEQVQHRKCEGVGA